MLTLYKMRIKGSEEILRMIWNGHDDAHDGGLIDPFIYGV
jgi:hypothetical protein